MLSKEIYVDEKYFDKDKEYELFSLLYANMNRKIYINLSKITNTIVEKFLLIKTKYSSMQIYINLSNTRNIDLEALKLLNGKGEIIKVEGGYEHGKLNKYEIHDFNDCCTYSSEELEAIIISLKQIESGLLPNWTKEQKVLYFINILQSRIKYHPKYNIAPSKEIRSLRGILTRQTVCAGYSLILKELCDRNSIECDLVFGKTSLDEQHISHAWNIVKFRDNYFPIDLTYNSFNYNMGSKTSVDSIFNAHSFIEEHIPASGEKIQNYKEVLKSIDGNFLREIFDSVSIAMEYDQIKLLREDIVLSQVKEVIIENEIIYRYIYSIKNSLNELSEPIMLYSKTNLDYFFANKATGNYVANGYEEMINNVLLSKKNIEKAISVNNFYLGRIVIDEELNEVIEIIIEKFLVDKLKRKTIKSYKRSNGTSFLLELIDGYPEKINNNNLYSYNVYEYIKKSNSYFVKQNVIYSDYNLFKIQNQNIIDNFLSRDYINLKTRDNGGYLGKCVPKIIKSHIPSKTSIEITSVHILNVVEKLLYSDLNEYNKNYEIINNKVLDKTKNTFVTNFETIIKAKISKLWLSAFYFTYGDKIKNYQAEFLYEEVSRSINNQLIDFGGIIPLLILDKYINDQLNNAFKLIFVLFNSYEKLDIFNSYYRIVNPAAVVKEYPISPFDSEQKVWEELMEYKAARREKNIRLRNKKG